METTDIKMETFIVRLLAFHAPQQLVVSFLGGLHVFRGFHFYGSPKQNHWILAVKMETTLIGVSNFTKDPVCPVVVPSCITNSCRKGR